MSRPFELTSPPLLSRGALRRDELVRADAAGLRARWMDARLIRADPRGRVAARDGALVRVAATELGPDPVDAAVLLGQDAGTDVWAVSVPFLPTPDGRRAETVELRMDGAGLEATDAALLATATALLGWHAKAGFCATCGAPTEAELAGWARRCVRNGHEEYPRTDPAVICLVHDGADQVLLGRQPTWPPGRFSVLAGFVEAGESLEACVHREIGEEVGVAVTDVRYLGSQPWPFPRSIMLGFQATADPSQPVVARDGEIAEAHWFSRNDVRAALASGDWNGDELPLRLPGSVSIARGMLESWALDEYPQ
ncbi:MAG: NAD(+) diphosphatase [Mycobacteriaceae bacterium]